MKYKKIITILVLCIVILSLAASAYAVFSIQGDGEYAFKSLHGETVKIYGKGLYKNESVSMAVQAKAQDIVTMALGIPLLIISLILSRKNLLKGRIILTGTLGYFLYTYVMYTFIAMYNPLFLVYVILMSASFFAFILSMISFDKEELSLAFDKALPVKFVGGFLTFIALMVGLLWLGRIVPPLLNGTVPLGLEHYTTLVIQGLDLGILLPTQIIAAVLLIKRKPFGYLLASVMTIKIITLLTAMTAMVISQVTAGVEISFVEMIMFPLFNIISIFSLFLILKNIKEKSVA